MTHDELREAVRQLFVETGQAHHEAFAATDGEDPEWPIWYAGFLQERLSTLLGTALTRSQLVYCLMFVEFERAARAPDVEWSGYYADHLAERFAPATSTATDKLALYYFPTCPFCRLVLAVIERLGIDVELRNIHESVAYRAELVDARSRATVPVLRITPAGGEERWMPESRDIAHYLEATYGRAA